MYEIIENVILEGEYNLSDMLKKIDTIWIKSHITDEQKEELVNLAREHADFEQGVDVIKEIKELKKRVTALEEKEQTEPGEEYEAYVPGKWYYKDDRITFTDGKRYICTAPDGVVCVWSPVEYPAYWEEVKE